MENNDEKGYEDRRIEEMWLILYGPKGHPEESLPSQVKTLTQSVKALGKFIWAMGILGGSLIVTELFNLIKNGV